MRNEENASQREREKGSLNQWRSRERFTLASYNQVAIRHWEVFRPAKCVTEYDIVF